MNSYRHHSHRRSGIRDAPPFTRRRAHHSTSLHEPLLLHPSSSTSTLLGTTTTSPRGHMELTSMTITPAYRPPTDVPVDPNAMEREGASASLSSSRKALPHASSYRPSSQGQAVHPHPVVRTDHATTVNANPAEDLAWPLLSHGCLCLQCVRTQEVGFTEQCGAFEEIVGPGLHCLPWPYRTVAGRLSLRLHQVDLTVETRTLDSVFVHVSLTILYRVAALRSYEAYYRLVHPSIQMQTYVLDAVRSQVPSLTLDALFASPSHIADAVFARLHREMLHYGYEIAATLVTKLDPAPEVRDAMNQVMASRRIKDAAPHKGESIKIQAIKQAEARAEALHLHGIGLAKARQVICTSMRENVDQWTTMDVRVAHPPSAKEVMQVLLVSQYMDLLSTLGKGSSPSLFVTHNPNAVLTNVEAIISS